MAHRSPLREIFGLICLALIVPKSDKASTPTGANTGSIIIDDVLDVIQTPSLSHETNAPFMTPSPRLTTATTQAIGLFPFILAPLAPIIGLLGDELLSSIAQLLLFHYLLPMMRVIKRYFLAMIAYANRCLGNRRAPGRDETFDTRQPAGEMDEESRSALPQATPTTPGSIENRRHNTLTSVLEVASISPTPERDLDSIRADSAEKDVKIQTLSKESQDRANTITNLDRRNNSLVENLRTALDPDSLYPSLQDVLVLANDLAQGFRRASKEVERQEKELEKERDRPEIKQFAEKTSEIKKLSEENVHLNHRIEDLVEEQQSSALATERTKQETKATEKRLRERLSAAEKVAGDAIDERTYMTLRNQFDDVVDQMTSARQEAQDAIDAQGRLNTELEAEKAKVSELQTTTQTSAAASQQSESQLATASAETQLAKERVTSLEREAEVKSKEMDDAKARAQSAEDQAASNATSIKELQQNLRAAQDQAENVNKSNKELKQELRRVEKRLEKDRVGKSGAADNNKLVQEISSLRSQLEEAGKKENEAFQDGFFKGIAENPFSSQAEGTAVNIHPQPHPSYQREDASVQTLESEEDPLYQRGRRETLETCEAEAKILIDRAVQEERQQGQQRLETAVAQREQAVKNSADEAWDGREAVWKAFVDTQVSNALSNQQTSLQAQLNTALQRATDAEAKLAAEIHRAEAAELEVERYKKGKLSQDGRIKGYREEIAARKQQGPTNPILRYAELSFLADERLRAHAIIEEFVNRNYDDDTKKVLQQLLTANRKIIDMRETLWKKSAKSTREELLEILHNADIDKDLWMSLYAPCRQVLVKQCRGITMRLAELRAAINQQPVPDKTALLNVLYQDRGDEGALWDDDDPHPTGLRDEDGDFKIPGSESQNPGARQKRLPKTRKPKPAVTAQIQDPQMPNDSRTDQNLKRDGTSGNAEANGSVEQHIEPQQDMRPIQDQGHSIPRHPQNGVSSLKAADNQKKTMLDLQGDVSDAELLGEIPPPQYQQQQQNNEPTTINPQAPSIQSSPFHNPLFYTAPADSSNPPPRVEKPSPLKPARLPRPYPNADFDFAAWKRREKAQSNKAPNESQAGTAASLPSSTSAPKIPSSTFSFATPIDRAPSVTSSSTKERPSSTFSFTAPEDKEPGE